MGRRIGGHDKDAVVLPVIELPVYRVHQVDIERCAALVTNCSIGKFFGSMAPPVSTPATQAPAARFPAALRCFARCLSNMGIFIQAPSVGKKADACLFLPEIRGAPDFHVQVNRRNASVGVVSDRCEKSHFGVELTGEVWVGAAHQWRRAHQVPHQREARRRLDLCISVALPIVFRRPQGFQLLTRLREECGRFWTGAAFPLTSDQDRPAPCRARTFICSTLTRASPDNHHSFINPITR